MFCLLKKEVFDVLKTKCKAKYDIVKRVHYDLVIKTESSQQIQKKEKKKKKRAFLNSSMHLSQSILAYNTIRMKDVLLL